MALRRFVRKGDLVGEGEYRSLLEQGDLMNILRANLRRRLEVIAEGLGRVFGLRQATRLIAAARIRPGIFPIDGIEREVEEPSTGIPNTFRVFAETRSSVSKIDDRVKDDHKCLFTGSVR